MSLVLLFIIAITVITSFKGFGDESFFRKYEFHIGSIRAGEHIRMITSAFLHADIGHLFFNMLTLYFFAPVVIGYFDSLSFLIIYAGSLIAGSLFTLYFHKNDYHYRAIGASGAVTGVLYAAILLQPNMSLYLFFIPIPIPAYLFGIGYLLYSIYGIKAKNDNIGHTAHFGGAIGGYVITIAKAPNMVTDNTLMVVLLLIPIIILFVLSKMGKL
ncbi:rhomboid family protein [Flavobacterium cauense R2A-7]|uniref:Rhomboid family protein n=1 Tax=Flavobacterium cauense R2A-7 TaxID=1341154 RepID=V6RVT2_9FLAO|nr:rhomboid family intramembrane serine protease [Flavobacterium cauense]ESU18623.1 rhomboid family protein [Flavobacterium cauense R2A-7]KGO80710.1 protease [Flavobacterium cauense R2A-7]TWI11859.1 rhomboid family protein [Flavobacterium cauense R2A-7]